MCYSLEAALLSHNDVRATKSLGHSVKRNTSFFNDMDPTKRSFSLSILNHYKTKQVHDPFCG